MADEQDDPGLDGRMGYTATVDVMYVTTKITNLSRLILMILVSPPSTKLSITRRFAATKILTSVCEKA
jgi:hypothetical protein